MPNQLPTPVIVAVRRTPPKPWYLSKTLWLNALVLALTAAESQLNMLQPLLPINVYALVAFALPVGNAVLRLLTNSALSSGAAADGVQS